MVAVTGTDRVAKHKVAGSTPVTRSFRVAALAALDRPRDTIGCMVGCMQRLYFAASTVSCIVRSAARAAASCVIR
jgi:hypothetical protein